MLNNTKKRKNSWSIWPYLLVAPATLIIIGVVFIPVINAFIMSLQNYDLRNPSGIEFLGLKNYIDAIKDPLFRSALYRTIMWVIFGVGFQFLFGFLLAIILVAPIKGQGVFRALGMVPWVTPGVLIGLMWRWIYDGNQGVLNDLLLKLGWISKKIPFLSQVESAFPSVIVAIVWQGIPFFALMIVAALQGVPTDLYEAAVIDGAGFWKRLFFVTIPSIKNTLFVTLLLRIIWVANSVDVIFNMTGGGPAYSTQTLSVYIFNKGNALDLGYASAMAVYLMLLLLIVAIPYLRMHFKEGN